MLRSWLATRSALLLLLLGFVFSSRVDATTLGATVSGPLIGGLGSLTGFVTFDSEAGQPTFVDITSYPIETMTIAVQTPFGSALWDGNDPLGGSTGGSSFAEIVIDVTGNAALSLGAVDLATGAILTADWNFCTGCYLGAPPDKVVLSDSIFSVIGLGGAGSLSGGFLTVRPTGAVVPEPGAGLVFGLGAWMIAASSAARSRSGREHQTL